MGRRQPIHNSRFYENEKKHEVVTFGNARGYGQRLHDHYNYPCPMCSEFEKLWTHCIAQNGVKHG